MGSESLIVLDTHVLVWWASDAPALTARAKHEIRRAVRHGPFTVSTMSLFEAATAVRRGRLSFGVPFERWLGALRTLPEVRFAPVTEDIASVAGGLDESIPGDPADRIIAATALALGAILVTADERLRAVPRLKTLW